MRQKQWLIILGIILAVLSALIYFIHFLIFRDPHHIFIYMIGDIAFVFIEILLVTLIIHQLLGTREKRLMLQKLNMLIGTFFSEVGTKLVTYFSDFDPRLDEIKQYLVVCDEWSEREFSNASRNLKRHDYRVEIEKVDLEKMRDFFKTKRDFLLRLLENPNLLEHETFTELLRAAFHLDEELESRDGLKSLPDSDLEHLEGDIKRVYILLVREWVDYMEYLKDNYPFLFSLAMRTNPFDEKASPVVRGEIA